MPIKSVELSYRSNFQFSGKYTDKGIEKQSSKPAVSNIFGTKEWFPGRQFFKKPGWGGMVSGWFRVLHWLWILSIIIALYNEIIIQVTVMQKQWEPWAYFPGMRLSHLWVMGEQWGAAGNADEASLTGRLLTSCHAALFLTDQGRILVLVSVLWSPALNPILGTLYKTNHPASSHFLNKCHKKLGSGRLISS